MSEYSGEKSLQFLLENGLNPNILDMNRSTPLLYSALNGQISFMILLRRFGSIINNCNNKNQVPFIEIIKMKNSFTLE
jgi:ankyrin repeat protein